VPLMHGTATLTIFNVLDSGNDMEFFCYHRDRPGSMALREELLEQHCSYMDRYQAEMIARGPTLAGTCEEG
jgi:hypothetical protein